uniref:Uncharacterized protein n=1 Tax=Panagrolaimus sp. JU765 TaxID=591449 RepID=A0AC34R114_9BILA
MRSASCRKIVWSEILKECQSSGYFNDKTVQWLFKSKWPGLKSNVEKKFIKSKSLSTIDEEIIETERLKDPLFCFLVGEDRKSVRSDVYDCMNWILKEVTGDEAEEEAPDEDDDFADFDYPPTEETHENVNHFIDDGFEDSDAEVIDLSPPSIHEIHPEDEPNVGSCVESEQELSMKTNLQQIMPNSDECTKAYINFLASIEKEWICLLKLKQEKTKQKIQKTKLEIEKLTNLSRRSYAEVIDFSSPSSHEPNVESCVESEQEHPLKTNPILQQIMPSSDECIKAYINFLASIEKEWIHLLKLKQEKTKQKIRKTKLEIEKLTNV